MPIGEKFPDNIENTANIETLPSEKESRKIESLPDVPEFAEEKISDLDDGKNEIENSGKTEAERIQEMYQPNASLSEKYRKLIGEFAARSREIADRAKTGIKEAAKGVVIGGMLAATAGIAEGNVLEKPSGKKQEGVKIEEINTNIAVEKSKVKIEEVEKRENHASEIAEKIRQELIEHYSSKEYLDRLIVEFGGKEERAKEVQLERVENLKTVEIDTSLSYAEFADKIKSEKTNADGIKDIFLITGVYNEKVRVPYDIDKKIKEAKILINQLKTIKGVKITDEIKKIAENELDMSLESILRHEITHAVTGEYGEMSNSSIEILKRSYMRSGNKADKYFGNPLELLERKKAMDREMEKLGIKKYSEEFIPEKHYHEVMDAYRQGLFSKDAKEFISIIEQDPNVYKKIFDEIADNKNIDSESIKPA
ncbi:MAG TPA: hypothetical protein PLB52_01300 [Candidatus Moranbacteria bacterium]|nr:hypothetical protein [Candidatus Moranbacteria bacterium]